MSIAWLPEMEDDQEDVGEMGLARSAEDRDGWRQSYNWKTKLANDVDVGRPRYYQGNSICLSVSYTTLGDPA